MCFGSINLTFYSYCFPDQEFTLQPFSAWMFTTRIPGSTGGGWKVGLQLCGSSVSAVQGSSEKLGRATFPPIKHRLHSGQPPTEERAGQICW